MRARPASLVLLAAFTAAPAMAQNPTVMKAGQWTSTMSGMGPRPMTHTYCLAESSLDRVAGADQAQQSCTKREVTPIANGVRLDFVCQGMAMQGTATATGTDAYRTDMTMRMPDGQSIHMVTESKWIGPCKPGERPVNASR